MKAIGVFTYELKYFERLKKSDLILANHPSFIDIVLLLGFVSNATCIVNSKLLKNPFTRSYLKSAGFISNEEEPEKIINIAKEKFKNNQTLIIFPEGTRSTPNKALEFKRGAANIAIRTKASVCLIIIHCNSVMLPKNAPWYKVPDTRPNFVFEVQPSFDMEKYIRDAEGVNATSQVARRLNSDLCDFFNKEIQNLG